MKKSYIAFLFLAACSGGQNHPPLDTVPYVNIDQYLGKWYEIARIDHGFQRGCVDSAAHYSMRDDGDISVLNTCVLPAKDNKLKEATGRAWVKDTVSNSKLKVQFFLKGIKLGFLSGDYWIVELDDDYSHVIVGSPNRKYLWILARTPTLDDQTYQGLLDKASSMQFDVNQLLKNEDLKAQY